MNVSFTGPGIMGSHMANNLLRHDDIRDAPAGLAKSVFKLDH